MDVTTERSISIRKGLFEQAERLAQELNTSPSRLVERAIEKYLSEYQPLPALNEPTGSQAGGESKAIYQGDIYWVQLENPAELVATIPHPYVVIQDNLFNHSRIDTVIVCALTSNIKRLSETPGNLLLDVGEANLPKQSVVEVSKVSTVHKAQLRDFIGSLSEQRVEQILAGMRFLQMTFFSR